MNAPLDPFTRGRMVRWDVETLTSQPFADPAEGELEMGPDEPPPRRSWLSRAIERERLSAEPAPVEATGIDPPEIAAAATPLDVPRDVPLDVPADVVMPEESPALDVPEPAAPPAAEQGFAEPAPAATEDAMHADPVLLRDSDMRWGEPPRRSFWRTLQDRLAGLAQLRRPPVSAALSYRYLARQIAVDLPRADRGRTVLLSAVVGPASNNEAMLMFSHALAEELDCRVLLIDGTFGEWGISAVLGHAGAPGLVDLVHDGDRGAGDLIQTTSRRNISVLPAGRTGIERPLPIRTGQVAALLEQAGQGFDYVLVQQGAITADTRYLPFAAKSDLVLLLAEEGVTLVGELDRSLDVFRGHQISSVRLMLCTPR